MKRTLINNLAIGLCALFAFSMHLPSYASPTSFVLNGRIVKPDNTELEDPNVDFIIQVLSDNDECLLFEETFNLNMTGSGGNFSLSLGTGTDTGNGGLANIIAAFDNSLPNQTALVCGTAATTYDPAPGDVRKLRLTFNDGSGDVTLSQDQIVESVPYSQFASFIGGKGLAELIQVNGSTAGLTQANLEAVFDGSTNSANLTALLNGSSSDYISSAPTSPPSFNSQIVNDVGTPAVASDAANKGYVDETLGGFTLDVSGVSTITGDGNVLTWDQTAGTWVAVTPTISDSSKLPLSGGTLTGLLEMNANIDMNTNDIVDSGFVILSPQRYLQVGAYTNTQETALVGTPLSTSQEGAIWFNSETNQIKYWDGAAVQVIGESRFLSDADGDTAISMEEVSDEDSIRFDTNGVERMIINEFGRIGIGTSVPTVGLDASALADALALPNGLTGERPATPANGMIRYNATTNKFEGYENGAWTDLITPAGGSGDFLADGSVAMTGQFRANAGTDANPGISFDGGNTTGFTGSSSFIGFNIGGTRKITLNSNVLYGNGAGTPLIRYNAAGSASTPAYSFTSDIDTGIFRSGTDEIAFSNGGTESFRINASGYLGIGTIAPGSRLNIAGTLNDFASSGLSFGDGDTGLFESADDVLRVRIAGSNRWYFETSRFGTNTGTGPVIRAVIAGNPNFVPEDNDLDTGVGYGGADNLVLFAGGERVRIDGTTGNVGIGVPAPGVSLDISNSTDAVALPSGTTMQRPTPANGMIRYNATTNKFEGYENGSWANLITTGGSGDFLADGSVPMTNNLQIGANWVGNDGGAEGLRFAANGNAEFSGQVSIGSGRVNMPGGSYIAAGTNNFRIHTNSTERLRVQNDDIGIADATPDARLEVSADGSTSGKIFLLSSNDDQDGDLFAVEESGDVGIGVASPDELLHIKREVAGVATFKIENLETANWGVGSRVLFEGDGDNLMGAIQSEWRGNSTRSGMTFQTRDNNATVNAIKIVGTSTYFGNEPFGPTAYGRANTFIETPAGNDVQTGLVISHVDQDGPASSGIGNQIIFQTETDVQATNAQSAAIVSVMDDATNTSKDGSLRFHTLGPNAAAGANTATEKLIINSNGDVGVGTSTPRAKLEVDGAIVSAAAPNNTSASTINFATGNLQYTNDNCQAFNLHNLKDGGTYRFIVKGTTAATCSFTADSDAGATSLTVNLPSGHGATTAGEHTVYTILVAGSDTYFSWITAFD